MRNNQIGRRNLSDDQRSVFALSIQERRSKRAKIEAGKVAGIKSGASRRGESNDSDTLTEAFTDWPEDSDCPKCGNGLYEWTPQGNTCRSCGYSTVPKPKTDTRKEVAKEYNLPERKLRTVAEVKKAAPELIAKVRSGETTLLQAKREIKEEKREIRREENPPAIQAEPSGKATRLPPHRGRVLFLVGLASPIGGARIWRGAGGKSR